MGLINAVNVTGPVCSTSYGLITQNIIKQLIERNIRVSLRPIGQVEPDVDCGYHEYIGQCNPKFYSNSPHLIIWHQFDLTKYRQPNCINIGFPIFELDNFDEREIASLNSCDVLMTCSKWGVDVLRKFCPNKPLGVLPLGIDPDIIKPTPQAGYENVRFVTCGKWEVRKNQLAVMRAFAEVFHKIRDVELAFLCYNDFLSKEENEKWANLAYSIGMNQNINIVEKRLNSHIEVNEFLNTQDVGVFPSHAEGWGLEAGELVSLNKKVIATNYSGHTEFLNNDNAYLIDIDELEDAIDFRWFWANGGKWAKFGKKQHDQLKKYMMQAYLDIKNQRNLPSTTPPESAKIYTWSKSVDTLVSFLETSC